MAKRKQSAPSGMLADIIEHSLHTGKDLKTANGYCSIISMWLFTFSRRKNVAFISWRNYGLMLRVKTYWM